MKKLLATLLLLSLAIPVSAGEVTYDEMIGVYAPNRQVLLEYLKGPEFFKRFKTPIGDLSTWYPVRPLLQITLEADDTHDKTIMEIETEAELPYESIPVDCPRSQKYQFKKCWFIKYGEMP
jgi:hypothetical protein